MTSQLTSLLNKAPSIELYARLKNSSKPILIYGTGDGAAKLIYALKQQGISYCDIFASDEFVRGQSFMGYTVKTFQQCKEIYGHCIVLVAFSSFLPSVIDHIEEIAKESELYIPDINVYGDPSVVFNTEYIQSHLQELEQVYRLLSDESSQVFFLQLLRYKLSGEREDLWSLDSPRRNYAKQITNVTTYCDLGAYIGDTLLEQKHLHPELEVAVAMEPEKRHHKKLSLLDGVFSKHVWVPAAASDQTGTLDFSDGKGRGSSVVSLPIEGLRPAKKNTVSTDTLDNVISAHCIDKVDLIKYDVEGFEYQAIMGSLNTIITHKPSLIVSLYHNHSDLFTLPLLLKKHIPNARFYLSRKRKCFPAWEVELTIIQ